MMYDDVYMQRCIDLAQKAGKYTKSNPNVGCVIVHENVIIGEGYHIKYGDKHAEINALLDVIEQHRHLLPNSTMYVSLEPCCIQGKTPPCSNTIIASGIKKIVIGAIDPNPLVNGLGVELLKKHGLEVTIGVKEIECNHLIRKFKINLKKRPYIILKWAQSYDGFMGHKTERILISNEYAQIYNHKLRTEVDGIVVGKNTAILDNPILTSRFFEGDNPVRIAFDPRLEIPMTHHLLSDGSKTIVVNDQREDTDNSIVYLKHEKSD
ncbi:MAG: Riboflavin biosynthesis protein RibD, partial [Bacteroidota bacterium]